MTQVPFPSLFLPDPADDTPYRAIGHVSVAARPSGAEDTAAEDIAAPPRWRFVDAAGLQAEVAILAADLVRVRLVPAGREPAHSWIVARTEWPPIPVRVGDRTDGLTLDTGAVTVEIATAPFRVTCRWADGEAFAADDLDLGMGCQGDAVLCHKRLPPDERILGAGERADPLDKRGRRLTFFNVDPHRPHSDATDNMYVNIPFWLGLRGSRAYGLLLDSVWQGALDAGAMSPERLTFGAAGGDLTYYVFAGPTPAAVLARYADLTGHMPLPPRWALGYQQSRWSYYPEDYVRAVAREFRARRIPCDVLYLDIEYMDGYRDFTWDPRRFPDPARLLADLRAEGFKVVPIVDAGVKVDPTDPTYADGLARDAFCRYPNGALYRGRVWPGECVFPDVSQEHVRAWWGERHRALTDAGVAGIWDDMNEPSLVASVTPTRTVGKATIAPDVVHRGGGADGPTIPHAAFHNAYGQQIAAASRAGLEHLRPGERPFVLTRAGTAGIQRSAAVWTGDNSGIWPHLALALRMCLGLGLSGVPFCGADVGGFWGDTSGELLARWTQLGAVLPFFRNHSARDTHAQEPWAFGQPVEAICRAAIELRYRLLPYLYTLFERAAAEGAPIARALAYASPADPAAAALDDELLLGDALLAAPVLTEHTDERAVYFPTGNWVDWWTGERQTGPARATVAAPLDLLPLYAREGAIIPLGPVLQHTEERDTDPITLACFLGGSGSHADGALYQDDGATTAYQAGATRTTRFFAGRDPGQIEVRAEAPDGAYDPGAHAWVVELHLPMSAPTVGPRPTSVRLDERDLPATSGLPSPSPSPAPTGAGSGLASPPRMESDPDEPPGWSVWQRRYERVVRVVLGRVRAPFTLVVGLEED